MKLECFLNMILMLSRFQKKIAVYFALVSKYYKIIKFFFIFFRFCRGSRIGVNSLKVGIENEVSLNMVMMTILCPAFCTIQSWKIQSLTRGQWKGTTEIV